MQSERASSFHNGSISRPARSTVAVVGLGSIGGAVAAFLRHANRHDLVACVRIPIERLILDWPEGTIEVPIRTITQATDATPVDWVLLCTKAHQVESAAPWLARLCGPRTRIGVLQNGIDHAGRLAPFVKDAIVVPTLVYYNGERLGPDHVRFRRAGEYDLAVRDDAEGQALAALLGGTPMRVLLSQGFGTLAWQKLLINAIANPITALTLQRQSVFRRPDIQELCLAILHEAVAVARSNGARLADDEAERILRTLLTYPAEAGTSMYFDRLAGRPFEVEALTGAIVAASERCGVPAPLNRMLLTLLRAASLGGSLLEK
jgi:2-dehydropantoate 2-reductase